MKSGILWVCVVVAVLFTLGAAALADPGEGVKLKAALFPCVPVGEDDAGGEAEYERDSLAQEGRFKIEIWGATLLRDDTLRVEADGQRVGSMLVDEYGRAILEVAGSAASDWRAEVDVTPTEIDGEKANAHYYSTDPECGRD